MKQKYRILLLILSISLFLTIGHFYFVESSAETGTDSASVLEVNASEFTKLGIDPKSMNNRIMGDFTNDNEITASEARIALRASAKLEIHLSHEQQFVLDINNDGTIQASDARSILRMSARLEQFIRISVSNKDTDDTEIEKDSYFDNKFYKIIETGSYPGYYDGAIIIHKVLAKQDIRISSSAIATDSSGEPIDKATSDIELTKGQYNYFAYAFTVNTDDAQLSFQAQAFVSSVSPDTRNAVELVKYSYNQENNFLLLTLKQNTEKISSFAEFKILYYKGDKIVGSDGSYINIYAENLRGKDTTDVAKIWVNSNMSFDRIEFFYEP